MNPGDWITGPRTAFRYDWAHRVIDKLALDRIERTVVEHDGVGVLDKVKRHLLEVSLGARHFLRRAKPVLVPVHDAGRRSERVTHRKRENYTHPPP